MGENFHEPYDPLVTRLRADDLNAPLSLLDRAATFLKNTVITCDGIAIWDRAQRELYWLAPLRIMFTRADGVLVENVVPAGEVVVELGSIVWVDLMDTNGAEVAIQHGAPALGSASNTITFNRLVLGQVNAAGGYFFAAHPGMASAVVNIEGTETS